MAIGVKCDEKQEVEMTWFKGRCGDEKQICIYMYVCIYMTCIYIYMEFRV